MLSSWRSRVLVPGLALALSCGASSDDDAPDCEHPDRDDDGHLAVDCGGDDCNDDDDAVHPGASEGAEEFTATLVSVDDEGCGGHEAADIAVDEEGLVHIVGTLDFCGEGISLLYLASGAEEWGIDDSDDCGPHCRVVSGRESGPWLEELVFCGEEFGECRSPRIAALPGGGAEVLNTEWSDWDFRTVRRLTQHDAVDGRWSAGAAVPGFGLVEPAFVIDADGLRHAVLRDDDSLTYITYAADGWTSERILAPPQVAGADIAVDRQGTVGVVFSTPSLVGFASRRHAVWEVSTVWSGTSWGTPSIAVGPDGIWQIAFGAGDRIALATGAPGAFEVVTVEEGVEPISPSIAVDLAGTAHVAFVGERGTEAHVAEVTGGDASVVAAASGLDLEAVAIVVDRSTAAHLVVSGCRGAGDWGDCGLLYATDAARADGVDRDCDGHDVPDAPRVCEDGTADADGDGHEALRCGGDDCDDADAAIHGTAADEVGDGIDRDCDGLDGTDADHDGHASDPSGGDDCDDADARVRPGVDDPEDDCVDQDCDGQGGPLSDVVGDGVDSDCDGVDGTDADDDGRPSIESGGTDCDDADPATYPGAPDDPADWRVEDVGEASAWPAPIVIDSSGAVHISYELDAADGSSAEVRHATPGPDGWEIETLATAGATPAYVAMAVQSESDVAVAYRDAAVGELRVARHETGRWSTEIVTATGQPGLWTAMTARGGSLRLSYTDESTFEVRCASDDLGEWSVEDVTGSVNGWWTGVAVDAAGVTTVAYHDFDAQNLVVATNGGGSWSSEVVESEGDAGLYPTVIVDRTGAAHTASRRNASDYLPVHHATNAGGAWQTDTVAPGEVTRDDFGHGTALALEPGGDDIRVAYVMAGDLYLARRDGEDWQSELVTEAVTFPSLAIDEAGNDHLSAVGDDGVVYVTNTPFVDGVDQDCDGTDG